MASVASALCKLLVMALFVGCPLLAHFFLRDHDAVLLRGFLLILPLVALACWALLRASRKLYCVAAVLIAACIVYAIEQRSHAGLAVIYGAPHALAYVFLLWLFGRTLMNGRVALITRLARGIHGTLPPSMEAYTRRVTLAWCVFSALQLVASALLLAFASLESWSLFVNILNAPLLALMFAGEYIYRVIRYPHHPHASIVQAVRAFTRHAVSFDAKTH
jgi:uncharacterized membrane protein